MIYVMIWMFIIVENIVFIIALDGFKPSIYSLEETPMNVESTPKV